MFGIMKSSSCTFVAELVVKDPTFSPGISAIKWMNNRSVMCGRGGATVTVMYVGITIGTVDRMGMALTTIAIEQ